MEEFFARLNDWHKKYFRYVLLLALVAVVIVVGIFLPRIIMLFLPFLLAWACSLLVGRLANLFERRLRMPRKLAAVLSVLLFVVVLALILSWLVRALIAGVVLLSHNINTLYELVKSYLLQTGDTLSRMFENLPDEIFTIVNDAYTELGGTLVRWISSWATSLAGGAFTVAKNLPETIVFIIVFIVSTYFFSKDPGLMRRMYTRITGEGTRQKLSLAKRELLSAAGGYIRAQLIIMAITAVELSVGFLILDVPLAILVAVLVALLDALPVLGTGTVLIPWSVVSFIIGDFRIGIGALIIYVVCLCVRNLIEPRLVSKSIGLHPLATIISMYVGLRIYGFLGMIIVPITVLCVVKLYHIGMFDWLFVNRKKNAEKEEA